MRKKTPTAARFPKLDCFLSDLPVSVALVPEVAPDADGSDVLPDVALLASSLVRAFVERCDLLLAGSHELAELLGAATGDLATLAERARAEGPSEIVVRGPQGIGALDRDGAWHVLDVHREAAVDPIGAGDAFNAGYIAVRLRGGSLLLPRDLPPRRAVRVRPGLPERRLLPGAAHATYPASQSA